MKIDYQSSGEWPSFSFKGKSLQCYSDNDFVEHEDQIVFLSEDEHGRCFIRLDHRDIVLLVKHIQKRLTTR